jgi:hypothetical protein
MLNNKVTPIQSLKQVAPERVPTRQRGEIPPKLLPRSLI